jgi:hypothetical protein
VAGEGVDFNPGFGCLLQSGGEKRIGLAMGGELQSVGALNDEYHGGPVAAGPDLYQF